MFTHSSNIGAARLGLQLGPDRMRQYFRSFGLFAAAPSELAESARPLAPRKLDQDTVASLSFGQAISVSPLALATGMGSVLNGGEYVPLTIRKVDPDHPPQGRRVISEATSRTMLDLMRLNATSGTGRGADALAPGYRLGGKTGTAEKAMGGRYVRNKLVSSFVAVFPTDGPLDADRYLVLIMLDEPKPTKETGGFAMGAQTAAPAAGRVIERIAPYLGVQRAAVNALTDAKPIADPRPAERRGAMSAMRLSELVHRDLAVDPEITGVTADSRQVRPGYLFAALPGAKIDGRDFVPAALAAGAAAILASDDIAGVRAPVVRESDPRRAYALAAAAFWGVQPRTCVAVTGTNGKTSVVAFCRQIFTRLGRSAASMGTLGVRAGDEQITPPGLTTLDAGDVARMLADLAGRGVTHVALEASSHGVSQRRLDGVRLAAAGFLNLTQDHLDYHGTMGAYRAAKLRLFEELLPRGATAVLNADSDQFEVFAEAAIRAGEPILSVGEQGQSLRLAARTATANGQRLSVRRAGPDATT